MLILKNSHQQYQKFIELFLDKLYIETNRHITLFEQQSIILKLWNADLTGIIPIIRPLYAKTNKLNIAADGTIITSHTSPYGRKICSCKLNIGEKCNCLRKFTDPDATWGWDSFHEKYVYGHGFHTFTACGSRYDLPIHLKCVSAARHDSITGIYHLKELVDSYVNIKFFSAYLAAPLKF